MISITKSADESGRLLKLFQELLDSFPERTATLESKRTQKDDGTILRLRQQTYVPPSSAPIPKMVSPPSLMCFSVAAPLLSCMEMSTNYWSVFVAWPSP
jgi:hypothetical protein